MIRKIKIKNYIILIGISLVTFIVCFYLFSWFKQYNELKVGDPIIKNTLQEVKYDNFESLLKERDFVVIYMCTTNEKICRNFEYKFVNYINEKNINEEIIYYNLGYRSIENNSLNKLFNKYKTDNLVKKIDDYPTIFVFNKGKIIDLLSGSDLTIEMVDHFLEGYDVLND